VNFYDEVLLELMTAVGAALFVANLFALIRRGNDRERAGQRSQRDLARTRPGSPVRSPSTTKRTGDLPQAPIVRTVAYMAIGLVVMAWGAASLLR
jgi:hypothetical protein